MVDLTWNVEFVARQAAGFTGADLENLVRTSALRNASQKAGVPAGDAAFTRRSHRRDRRSNVFKATGSGIRGQTNDVTENALIQQMNPYVRDTVCTYYAAQTLVGMMCPNYDDIAKVRVFANGEETGQIVSAKPDEVGADGAASVKRRTWYESKMTVLVAGQMAERYLYGPDKVSQYGVLDMKEATAMACEMVMMHGGRTWGPSRFCRTCPRRRSTSRLGSRKGRTRWTPAARSKLWGAPEGKGEDLQSALEGEAAEQRMQMLLLGISDELDLLIANEVRKIFVKACQRAVMIMHDPKGTEMLFTLREALSTAKEINGLNLHRVFDKFGLVKHRDFNLVDLDWGKEYELYWDEFVNHIWADDANNTGFWKLVQEQWQYSVVEPTMYEREVRGPKKAGGDKSQGASAKARMRRSSRISPSGRASNVLRFAGRGRAREMLMYAQGGAGPHPMTGGRRCMTGRGFGKRGHPHGAGLENPHVPKEEWWLASSRRPSIPGASATTTGRDGRPRPPPQARPLDISRQRPRAMAAGGAAPAAARRGFRKRSRGLRGSMAPHEDARADRR